MKHSILIIDNEIETLKYVGANLQVRGYTVVSTQTGKHGLKLFEQQPCDLIISELILPDMDGSRLCETIRQTSNVPILILSTQKQETEIVRVLDCGADDYLTKPFGLEEFLARVRALLRRAYPTSRHAPLTIGNLTINQQHKRATIAENDLFLSRTEFALLAYLATNAGHVLTHRMLLQNVWGHEYYHETEYLWAYIHRLRAKLRQASNPPITIETHAGVGYYLKIPQ